MHLLVLLRRGLAKEIQVTGWVFSSGENSGVMVVQENGEVVGLSNTRLRYMTFRIWGQNTLAIDCGA